MPDSEQIAIPFATPGPRVVTVRRMYLTAIGVSLVVGFVVSSCLMAYYHSRYAIKIIVYDLPAKLQLIQTSVTEGKITVQQAEQVSLLEIADAKKIADSVPSNYIVMTGGVVLGNHAQIIGQ